ncbi:multicopper oxidase domain-containing protein [Haladaptatus sp. DJG-WS-42]|uniref:multicopper oxidase domain-containing protein n=1 Tax=Haladaptatus sp. DJG-WS-42 TaxID=3120516 RepID=UPI0030CEB7DC
MPSHDYKTAGAMTKTLEERLVGALKGESIDRRTVLGGLGLAGAAGIAGFSNDVAAAGDHDDTKHHGNFGAVGEYSSTQFDPHEYLYQFNTGYDGQESVEQEVYFEGDQRVRRFELNAVDTEIEIAPGITFSAWAYNGQVPGPTLRVTEGDIIEVEFTNRGRHAHTIHPHVKNINPAMDGIPTNGPGVLETGESYTYRWKAQPCGVQFYHCHSLPLKEHIHRGLYGVIIVDPDPEQVRENPRDYINYDGPMTDDLVSQLVTKAESRNHEYDEGEDVNEMVMVMNGFDTNFDGDNEVYAANTRAFAYGVGDTDGKGNWEPGETKRPIQVDGQQLQRVYLVNAIEFDAINSFHTHSNFFDYYDHGTTLTPTLKTVDTVMQCQAQRGILEIDYSDHEPGLYMFHAHQSEFAELGWMSFFEVV